MSYTTTSARPRIAQFRHLVLTAEKMFQGPVSELSAEVSGELAEVRILPQRGASFPLLAVLQAGGIEEVIAFCKGSVIKEKLFQQLALFLRLTPSDAEWHYFPRHMGEGYIISIVVGHPSALKIARDHGLV